MRSLLCAAIAAVVAVILVGCTSAPEPKLVLTHSALADLFPTTTDYRPIKPTVNWIANDPSDEYLTKRELKQLNAKVAEPSALEFGAACARAQAVSPRVTWVEIGQQTVSYGQTVEIVTIIRTSSIRSAQATLNAKIAEMHVCSANQGNVIYTPINAEVPDSAAFTFLGSPTGASDFLAYGRVGQFLVQVSGDYADGATVGAGTFKIVMDHVTALAERSLTTARPRLATQTPTVALPQPLQTPAPQKGELARLTTGDSVDFIGTGLTLPPAKYGYAVEWGCSSTNPKAKAGWELDNINDHDAMMGRSSGPCDGTGQMDVDSSLTSGYASVDFHFVGDYNGNDMYAVLIPAPDYGH